MGVPELMGVVERAGELLGNFLALNTSLPATSL